jgi:hypothetical protein
LVISSACMATIVDGDIDAVKPITAIGSLDECARTL